MIKISKMKISDYENVYTLWSGTKGMGMRSLDDSYKGIEKFLERNPDTCFIAEEDKKIVGVLLCGNDGRRAYIYHTAVDEKRRGQGIGTQLVKTCINALAEMGINKAALVAYKNNQTGNLFWERMGFTTRDDLTYRNYTINKNNI